MDHDLVSWEGQKSSRPLLHRLSTVTIERLLKTLPNVHVVGIPSDAKFFVSDWGNKVDFGIGLWAQARQDT